MLLFRHIIQRSHNTKAFISTFALTLHTQANDDDDDDEMCLVMNSWSLIMIWISNWFLFTSFIVYTYTWPVFVYVMLFPYFTYASLYFGLLFGLLKLHCMPFYSTTTYFVQIFFFNRSTWKRIFFSQSQFRYHFVLFSFVVDAVAATTTAAVQYR